jgi:protein-disulfide isomerase
MLEGGGEGRCGVSRRGNRVCADAPVGRAKHAANVNRNSRSIFIAVVATAATVAATLIGVSAVRGDPPQRSAVPTSGAQYELFAGIPQQGIVLGSTAAPVTLVEFADLQCPYCSDFTRAGLPSIVEEYVRTGRVKLVFQGLAFLGPDSRTALRAVLAAGMQNRAWDFLHGLYGRQGAENAGWVTKQLLREVARDVRGLDVQRMLRQSNSPAVTRLMRDAARFARDGGVSGTPTFLVGNSGGVLRRVQLSSLSAEALRPALDAALGS